MENIISNQTVGARSVWSEVKVTQSCLTLCDPMDSIVNEILQARILEWAVFPFSRGSSQLRDRTQVSCIAGRVLPAELPGKAPGVCQSWKTKCIKQKVLSTVSKCYLIGQINWSCKSDTRLTIWRSLMNLIRLIVAQ